MNDRKNFFGNKYPSVRALSRRVARREGEGRGRGEKKYRERVQCTLSPQTVPGRCMDKAGSIIPLSLFPLARIRN